MQYMEYISIPVSLPHVNYTHTLQFYGNQIAGLRLKVPNNRNRIPSVELQMCGA